MAQPFVAVSVRFPVPDHEVLFQQAACERIPLSEVIRRAVSEYAARHREHEVGSVAAE